MIVREDTSGIKLVPENQMEAGALYWLATRFKAQPVILKFDTFRSDNSSYANYIPALWVERES